MTLIAPTQSAVQRTCLCGYSAPVIRTDFIDGRTGGQSLPVAWHHRSICSTCQVQNCFIHKGLFPCD